MYHKVTIVGNLGRDPELRYTPTGSPVCNFTIAANRKRKDADDEVIWFRVTCWGSTAEACNQYLSKGRLVLVEGSLRGDENGSPRVWTASDGTARASFEVTAHVVKFLGSARVDDGQAGEAGQEEQEELPF